MVRNLIVIFCCFILAGCATTRGTSNLEMQNRIDDLENELKAKDYELERVTSELRKTKQQNAYKQNDYASPAKRVNKQKAAVVQSDSKDSKSVIKVSGVTAVQVQSALKKAGFYQGKVDGKIGAKTKTAIKSFQRKNSLTVDGVVGKGTWAKLKKYI